MRPQPTFLVRFSDGEEIAFQEASNLEPPTVEHRAKIPPIHKTNDVTLKRGVIASNAALELVEEHEATVGCNQVARRTRPHHRYLEAGERTAGEGDRTGPELERK